MYQWILYLHIVSVVVSIGPVMIFLPMINKMREADQTKILVLIDVFRSIVWGIKHAGHVLVTTGLLLMWMGGWGWKNSWLLATFIIIMGTLFFIARAFTPILNQLEQTGQDRSGLIKRLTNATAGYIFIMLILLFLMVLKPNLW